MKNDEVIEAIKKRDAAAVAALLDEDRSLLRAKSGNTSAILLAVYHGQKEIAQLFVDRGAELTFAEASALGDLGRARAMLNRDPSLVHSYSDDGYPALGLAVFFRSPELARDLIERGADVNAVARNQQRVAPVHAAASVGDRDMLRLLLEKGADANARQELGFVPLFTAALHGDIEMAKLLIDHGADRNVKADDGRVAADFAAEAGKTAFVEWLKTY